MVPTTRGENTYVLYHWTHRDNVESILENGLNIGYSQSGMPVVYCCTTDNVGWAAGHIAQRHKWELEDLVLIRVVVRQAEMIKSGRCGVYYFRETQHNVSRI